MIEVNPTPLPEPVTEAQQGECEPPFTLTGYDYEVKSWPAFFSKMVAGIKRHDMRDKRDRDYKVGDRVLLREYDPFGGGYTGRWAIFRITYITSNETPCAMSSAALDNNFCILSMRLLETEVE